MWNKNQHFLIKNLFTFKRQTIYKQCSIRFRVKDFEGVGFLNKNTYSFFSSSKFLLQNKHKLYKKSVKSLAF